VTVAGLITSDDLIREVKKETENRKQKTDKNLLTVIIPSVMLRPFTQNFLDGKTLDYVKNKTGLEFFVINDYYSTKEIIDFIVSKES